MKAILPLSLLSLTAGLAAQDCQKAKACPSTSLTSPQQDCSKTKTSLTSSDTPKSRIAKKLAALSDADRKVIGKAMADLSECPFGSRMPASFSTLHKLYAEAVASLDKIASHPKADADLAKALKAEISAIRQAAKVNDATIAVMKSFATTVGDCCESEKGGCCDSGKAECCETAKAAAEQTVCNVSLAANLAKDWGNVAADYKALPAEKKQKLGKAYLVLKEKGFDIGAVTSHALQKQHALLGKAIAGMKCPVAGVFAKNAKALAACETSRKCCDAATTRLIAAEKLMAAIPGVVAKKATSKTGAAKTGCEGTEAKSCPSKVKTKTEINN